ncbi:hypothetical protein [Aeropyrum pernix]|uniref:hypothetical protein n=1 Tax=Aeropyrum pernix TaxID=56636 RepID=UPI00103814EC|nr:hypothetical protein [Aeropyrum pernix]
MEPGRITVFDATYGRGIFYASWPRLKLLIGADIRILPWVVIPDAFIQKPVWSSWRIVARMGVKPDIVVIDPPWVDRGSSTRRYYGLDLALGGPRLILNEAIKGARELGASHVIIHYKDRVEPEGYGLVKEVFFEPVTRYMKRSRRSPYTWFGLFKRV